MQHADECKVPNEKEKVEYKVKICSIASSSEGNCIFVEAGNDKYLIDVGISRIRVVNGLKSIQVEPEEIKGIFITHEHSDHTSGLMTWLKKYPAKVYGTGKTIRSIIDRAGEKAVSDSDFDSKWSIIEAGHSFSIGELKVHPFHISHDARDPVAYTFEYNNEKAGIATDLGTYNEETIKALSGCHFLLLEANHDQSMLQVGKYPYELKRRILGDLGHLSNEKCGKLAASLLPSGLRIILLGHMSKDNNFPELAYETVRYELERTKFSGLSNVRLHVADRKNPSELFLLS